MEENLSVGGWIDPEFMRKMLIRRNMKSLQNRTERSKAHIASFEIALFRSYTLYFWSRKFDSRFIALNDFIIEQGFFIDMK